jgi:hypothetical protein
MQSGLRYLLLSASLAVAAVPDMARAQGSVGGSIGNDQRSLSGTRAAPPPARAVEPARRSKPEPARRAARPSGGGGGASGGGVSAFDGAWAVTSVGSPCGSSSETVVITSGRVVGQYGGGQVSASGATTGAFSGGGISWTSQGRFSARTGSGTFRRSDGCAGTWTASKR